MAINLSFGYKVSSDEPIDNRISLTKAEMLAADEFDYPEVYFAFCKDDGQFYKFDVNSDFDTETGYFSKLELGGNTPTSDSGTTAEMNDALADASLGDLWYNTDDNKVYYCAVDSEGNKSWVEKEPTAGEMMYDSTNDKILYYDGTQWKEIGGGIEHQSSVSPSSTGEPGSIVYDETAGQYKTYEPQKSGDTSAVWLSMAKVWEGTAAEFNALDSTGDGLKWSQRHPDVIVFITD